jgi:16S rRNA C1402 N4-methylase RsmH
MTFGAGGHTKALLSKNPESKVFALDRDPHAFALACELQNELPGRVVPMLGRFTQIESLLKQHSVKPNSLDAVDINFLKPNISQNLKFTCQIGFD